jgi:hypothetical protein
VGTVSKDRVRTLPPSYRRERLRRTNIGTDCLGGEGEDSGKVGEERFQRYTAVYGWLVSSWLIFYSESSRREAEWSERGQSSREREREREHRRVIK